VVIAPTADHARNHIACATAEVWTYCWEAVLTWRSSTDSLATYETRHTMTSVDELVELVLHSSYDPRIVSYSYHRYTELNLAAAPTECPQCREPYADHPPRQRWLSCVCGAHIVYNCVACGSRQIYPVPTVECSDTAPFPLAKSA